MNTKNNFKAQETNRRINDVFISLLISKPISGITIDDICRRCGINRSTFYRHYRDIYDLYEQLQRRMMADAHTAYFAPVEDGHLPFSRKCFQSLFQYVADHFDYYSTMLVHKENVRVVDFMQTRAENVNMQPLIQTARLESIDEEHFRMAYFDGGLNAIIRHWVQTGCKIAPKDLAYFMEKEYQYEVAEIEKAAIVQKK